MSEPAWSQLGYARKEFLDVVAAFEIEDAGLWMCDPPVSSDGESIRDWATDVATHGVGVFAMGSLGYAIPHPPLGDWRGAGRRVVVAARHYFFGVWRDSFDWLHGEHFDRAKARTNLPWIDLYRSALAIALSLDDGESADTLWEWPGADLPFDEGLDDLTEEDNAYQIWLASRVRGEPAPTRDAQLPIVVDGKRRRPKLAQATAQALFDRDTVAFTKALTAQLRNHRQHEFNTKQLDGAICLEATVLWHLAKRQGLGTEEPSAELMVFIPRP